jgi:hypothetical protein
VVWSLRQPITYSDVPGWMGLRQRSGHAARAAEVGQPSDNGPMATYGYRCVQDGDFDVSRPLGTAPTKSVCPVCNNEAARVFRAPMLSLAPRALRAAIDRTEKSRDEPDVVPALPPRSVRSQNSPARQNPAWRHLPRP